MREARWLLLLIFAWSCVGGRARAQDGREPAAAATDADADTATETEANGERATAPDTETETSPESATEADTETETSPESATEAETEAETDTEAETTGAALVYRLEGIRIIGNRTTAEHVIRRYVAVREGELLDVDDERIEQTRYTLLGTGFFSGVRLSLERGSERGRVVLRIEVQERTTFQIDNVVLGVSEGLAGTYERAGTPIVPYGGISVSDANLLGTGDAFSGTLLVSEPQQGVRLRFEDPAAFGSPFALSAMGFFNHGREFFGDDDVLVTPMRCPPGEPMPCEAARSALVGYLRGGGALGTGVSLAPEVRLSVAYQLEIVSVLSRPDAASELRGLDVVPVDFRVQDGTSAVSMLDVSLVLDERDSASLTRSGSLVYLRFDLASRLLGSDYDFFRAEALARHWLPLPGWDHTLRLSLFAGAALDETPFFYRFYAADLSDLVPSRLLELSLDRRGPLDLFGNSMAEHRTGELAARLDLEYQLQLFRGDEDFRSFWVYANSGVYLLGDVADFQRPIRGYSGIDLLPIDLTFDVGVRIDTSVGVFQIGFSTLLGFVSVG
ncbi:MAG: hypothetical protein OHK0013_16840 [Sandaracinaceae bacterium]